MKQIKCIKAERLYRAYETTVTLPSYGPAILSPREKRLRERLRVLAAAIPPPNSGKVKTQVGWLIKRDPPLLLVGTLVRNVYSGDEDVTFQYMNP